MTLHRIHPPASRVPISHRVIRALRDLRVSGVLLVLTLLPTAAPAHAKAPVRVDETSAAAGPTRERMRESARDAVRAASGDRAAFARSAYIIHLPGIAGPMWFDRRFAEGLVAGGAGSEVEIFDWVGRRRGLGALMGLEENRRQARLLAEHIIELKAKQPDRALVITAHSGGTAVAAWALEMLPEVQGTEARSHEGTKAVASQPHGDEAKEPQAPPLVDGVILIASGLSSEYDLAPMLRQVRGGVFHLSSNADNFILGAGTIVFGTLDRKNGLAAGKTGFYLPAGVDPAAYARFTEVPYDRAWAELGHYGDHESMMSIRFGSTIVADLVRSSLGLEVALPATRPASPAPVREPPAASDLRDGASHSETVINPD